MGWGSNSPYWGNFLKYKLRKKDEIKVKSKKGAIILPAIVIFGVGNKIVNNLLCENVELLKIEG